MKLSAPLYQLKKEARRQARDDGRPLHAALDAVARGEGFRSWSHLVAAARDGGPARRILDRLAPGDMVLLGARPGQGKTLLGLELALEAARRGRGGHFFTLEYHPGDVADRLRALGLDPASVGDGFTIDTSDDISAGHIVERVSGAPPGSLAVVDYLQILDQCRQKPPLAKQVAQLAAFARDTGICVVALSQIDRSFELSAAQMPGFADIRLPNPLDLSLFSKAVFLHDGEIALKIP